MHSFTNRLLDQVTYIIFTMKIIPALPLGVKAIESDYICRSNQVVAGRNIWVDALAFTKKVDELNCLHKIAACMDLAAEKRLACALLT